MANLRPIIKVPVWDLPIRLFHWILVILIVVSIVSVKIGGNAMILHERSGYAILALLIFRLIWGFVGGTHARFASFVRGPAASIRYARGMFSNNAERYLGHNPLGAWSVIALLVSITVQAVTGLFADDEIAFQGPLAKYVSSETVSLAMRIHHFNENVLYVLVGLHLAAILFYLIVKRENLVGPMITGRKAWNEAVEDSRAGSLALAAGILIAAAAAVYFFIVRA